MDPSPDLPQSSMENPDISDPWIGIVLASYVVIRRIGEGGMGVIYLGRHQSLERLAAIKFLSHELVTDEGYIELFLREAKSAANMSHPNIISVYDAGMAGENVYYFIMEYVEGRDLHSILKSSDVLSVKDATEYVRQAANALAYAHHKHIIHRDIKPENLMLTGEGVIKVGDLGLAKWAGDPDGFMTQHGMVFGSPYYISPERLRDANCADPRSDIYSLGATLYHLVTGKLPYDGSTPVIMAKHLDDPVPEPRNDNSHLPTDLCDIIKKMMAKELRNRFQTMDQVEEAIIDYQLKHYGASPALRRDTRSVREKQASDSSSAFISEEIANATTQLIQHPSRSKRVWLLATTLLVSGILLGTLFLLKARPQHPPTPPQRGPNPVSQDQALPKAKEIVIPKEIAIQEVLADFNPRSGGKAAVISAWSSYPPNPRGSCSTTIHPNGGPDGSAVWRIDYDVSPSGSFAGATLNLDSRDLGGNDTVKLKIRNYSEHRQASSVLVSVRTRKGTDDGATRQELSAVTDWQTVEIPLASSLPIVEICIQVRHELNEANVGIIAVDDIALTKK